MTNPTRKTGFHLPTGVLGGTLTSNGDSLVGASMDGVYRVQLGDGQHERIDKHQSYVSSVRFVDESTIVTAGYDGRLHWTEVASGTSFRNRQVHEFWSWDMAVSPNRMLIASVTGQYIAGGYKYEPLAEREPSVVLLSADSGEVLFQWAHVPSVQAVAFSPDSQFVAAGNLMGEVRIWNTSTGLLAAQFTTSDFTSWGIIKSHCYLGGIFALAFTPDGKDLLLAGMGPMRDPMAGNGRQLWQRWSWQPDTPSKTGEIRSEDAGEGLMESLAVHPAGEYFVMGGRLRGGDWNVAMFQLADGKQIAKLKTGYRVTEAMFTADGRRLILVGAQGQPNKLKDGAFADFGRVEVYDLT